jgi:hypothetical protein
MSVPTFTTLTTAVWAACVVLLLVALVIAWQGRLVMALGISAAGALLFNVPPAALMMQFIKLNFDRQDQLLESGVGKAVSAIALVFAMTGVMPFLTIFIASAVLILLFYGVGSVVR